jgi:S1-C subfamily serine protease
LAPTPPKTGVTRRWVALLLASTCLLLGAVGTAGCGSGSDNALGKTEQRQLVDKVLGATVAVKSQFGKDTAEGSGIVFDALQGLVLTNAHIAWTKDVEAEVTTVDGTQAHGVLQARSSCDDLSVLQLHPRPAGIVPLPWGNSTTLNVGDHVTTIGLLPAGGEPGPAKTSVEVSVASTELSAKVHPLLPEMSVIRYQGPVGTPPTPGAPVVNDHGELVGMNVYVHGQSASGYYYALPTRIIRERLGPDFSPGSHVSPQNVKRGCHHQLRRLVDQLYPSYKPGGGKPHMKDKMGGGGSGDSMGGH